jgi:bifunctional non-homologous end joining protein LigD
MPAKVEVTHADRVLFPADGITKGDLVEYYTDIAGVMVPHLKARPLTLWRYPRGIDQKGFVQQDFADSLPDWMGRVEVAKEGGTVVHPTADGRDALRGSPTRTVSSCTQGYPGATACTRRTASSSTWTRPTRTSLR